MWPIVKAVFCWGVTVVFVSAAGAGFAVGEWEPSCGAVLVALSAYPPLWRYPPFRLTRVPAHVRWTIGIIGFVIIGITAPDEFQDHPAKPTQVTQPGHHG